MKSINNTTEYDDTLFYRAITASLRKLLICPVEKPYTIMQIRTKNKNAGYGIQDNGRLQQSVCIAKNGNVPVKACADGEIVAVYPAPDGHPVYGGMCIIRHECGIYTAYGHIKTTPATAVGAAVKQGDTLGLMGATGQDSEQHLHFEILIDPAFLF